MTRTTHILPFLLLAATTPANAALVAMNAKAPVDVLSVLVASPASPKVPEATTQTRSSLQRPLYFKAALYHELERQCFSGSGLLVASTWRLGIPSTGQPRACSEPDGSDKTGSDRKGTGAAGEVTQIPPPPGSASLVLSALVSVGSWQLGRSAKARVHWGVLPDWYHAEGPEQIGHAFALDLAFDVSLMPACIFDVPVSTTPLGSRFARLDVNAHRLISQQIPSVTTPRGPPQHA